jgi:asparagine synthase (glutamine-hydrolysing)
MMRAEWAIEYADPPWVARLDRSLFGGRLESTFVGLHKFTHFSLWYRGVLSGYVREMLLDPRTLARPYLNARNVEALVESHVKGEANHTPTIHKLLGLEYLHRLFIDAI